jgi:hypothetical protein
MTHLLVGILFFVGIYFLFIILNKLITKTIFKDFDKIL